jgi:hypothetical protein
MTRAEQAALRAQKLKTELDAKSHELAKVQARQRAFARDVRNKRSYQVGALADEAGLFTWSNADLAAVFAVLASLREAPNPAAVLAGLMPRTRPSNGLATPQDPAHRVADLEPQGQSL